MELRLCVGGQSPPMASHSHRSCTLTPYARVGRLCTPRQTASGRVGVTHISGSPPLALCRVVATRALSSRSVTPTTTTAAATTGESEGPSLTLLPFSLVAIEAFTVWPALAEETAAYNPAGGSQLFETVAGVAYTLLVVWFLGRTISRRVNKFTTERVGGSAPSAQAKEEEGSVIIPSDQGKAATPLGALTGAAIAFAISTVLWQLCLKVDDYFDHQTISTQFTVQKLQITIQTITRGLVYLCTFIFAANGTGLLGLAAAMVVAPDAVKDPVIAEKQRDPLADVSASKPLSLRKSDDEAGDWKL